MKVSLLRGRGVLGRNHDGLHVVGDDDGKLPGYMQVIHQFEEGPEEASFPLSEAADWCGPPT